MDRQRLKEARESRQLSLSRLSELTGLRKSTLQRWETGITKKIPVEAVTILERALSLPSGYLMGWEEEKPGGDLTVLESSCMRRIPVYESVSAGFGAFADNQIVDYAPLYIPSEQEAMNTLCIRVSGDSMFPTIEDGDLIQVEKTESVDSGTVAVLLIEGEDAVVKKVVYTADRIELRSFNPMYPPRVFEGADVLRVSVIGRVKKVIKTL